MSLSLFYPEMNQAVPGVTMSPGQEVGYGECQVPSPSQWSDPCYSPQSFHSPQHLPGELEKVKEEPFPPSPVPTLGTYPPSPNSTQGSIPPSPPSLHHISPYARPQPKKEGFETSLNLRDLVAETTTLTNLHSPPTYTTYSDHPLLRGRLEDNTFQKKMSAPPYKSPQVNDCLGFLDMLVDVKQEVIEEEVSMGSSCGSPASPPQPTAPPQPQAQPNIQPQSVTCQRDILETVEHLALEHARQNVQRVSDSLKIPHDPAHWNVEDVKAWLELQAAHLQLPPLVLNLWNMGGPALLKLSESQFRQMAPIGGELLYAQLEIWRGALHAAPKLQQPFYWNFQQPEPIHHHNLYSYVQQQQQQQVPQLEPPSQMGSSNQMGSPPHVVSSSHMGSPMHVGSPSQLGSSSSPPLSLNAGMGQVPTPVVQVTQQHQQQQQQQQQRLQAGGATTCQPQPTGPSPQPAQQQQQQASGTVYLEEQCHDMAALLQQSTSPKAAHPARLPAHSPQEDVFDSEEEVEEDTIGTPTTGRGGTHIHLWQFLKELLQQPQLYGSCIRWLDRQKGVFKIEDSVRVAKLWGKRKNRPAMNYDKLSRSIRQYYKKGIMKKTERSQRLVYQFCNPYNL